MSVYYKAVAVPFKPFVQWHSWANNEKEFQALQLENDPLIMVESEIPALLYGVCPLKINDDGELEERTAEEMDGYEAEYINEQAQSGYQMKWRNLNAATFNYDDHEFPMHETARLFYTAIEKMPSNAKVLSTTGIYTLEGVDIPAFMNEYYIRLRAITQPEV